MPSLRGEVNGYPVYAGAGTQAVIKVLGHQYRWLTDGYDLEIGHF